MRTTLRILVSIISLATLGAGATPANADTEGFFLGLDLHWNRLGGAGAPSDPSPNEVFISDDGGGAHLFLGWGLSPSFPLRLSIAASGHDTSDPDVTVAYSSITIDGMYLFRNPEPLRPYLFGGFGGYSLRSRKDALDWDTTGPGIVFGGGLLSFFGETFAVDCAVRAELVNWEKTRATLHTTAGDLSVETPIEAEGSAVKILVGGSWWF